MTLQQVAPTVPQAEENTAEGQVADILALYKGEQSELIPILQRVQGELGYLPELAMRQVAGFVGVPDSKVFGIATFYAQFKLVPTGRKIIRVGRGTACHVRGSTRLLNEMEKELGIGPGETTPDLEYTLETVACFGSCALAPIVVVDDKVHGRMTVPQ
ncbi:MAG: NAD(P)H-dependent oxidoreductase subunit E, partial [Dehalococcoidia bacterium]